jgi:hypothetical protein
MPVVELVGRAVGIPAFAEDEQVGALAERVGVHGHGAEVDVRVVTGSLAGRRAIEIPLWKIIDAAGRARQRLEPASA